MDTAPQVPFVKKLEEDPVSRSLAKPEPFAKPGSIGKPGAPTNQKTTRVRTLNWKRGRGRPRIHPKDRRAVNFY